MKALNIKASELMANTTIEMRVTGLKRLRFKLFLLGILFKLIKLIDPTVRITFGCDDK